MVWQILDVNNVQKLSATNASMTADWLQLLLMTATMVLMVKIFKQHSYLQAHYVLGFRV